MGTFSIEGGFKLKGDIHPQGAKNEALQVICASLLTSEKVVIDNIPQIEGKFIKNAIRILDLMPIKLPKRVKVTYFLEHFL